MLEWEESKPVEIIGKLRIFIYLFIPVLTGIFYYGYQHPIQVIFLWPLILILPVYYCRHNITSQDCRNTCLALIDLVYVGYYICLWRNWSLFLLIVLPMSTVCHTNKSWIIGFVGLVGVFFEWLFLRRSSEFSIQIILHCSFIIIWMLILKSLTLMVLREKNEKLAVKRYLDELCLAYDNLKDKNSVLTYLAQTDALTELFNYRFFETAISNYFEESKLCGHPLSLLLIDVDHFKNINDTFGHRFGDDALKSIARILRESVRRNDLVCRYGGEEFTVILPKTNLNQAKELAERICSAVRNIEHLEVSIERITVSIGVSAFPEEAKSIQELSEFADQALYEAKRQGRDCVVARRILCSNLPS